jgi:hypothetical protein
MESKSQSEQVNHISVRRKATIARQTAAGTAARDEMERAVVKPRSGSKKRALIQLLEEKFPDYMPVLEMAAKAIHISKLADQRPNDAMMQMDAVNAHEKVAKYVTPQLKAIDLTSGGEQIQFGFQLNLASISK